MKTLILLLILLSGRAIAASYTFVWDPPLSGIPDFYKFYQAGNGATNKLITLPGTITTWTVNTTTTGITYQYWVTAQTFTIETGPSNVLEIKGTAGTPPRSLRVPGISGARTRRTRSGGQQLIGR